MWIFPEAVRITLAGLFQAASGAVTLRWQASFQDAYTTQCHIVTPLFSCLFF